MIIYLQVPVSAKRREPVFAKWRARQETAVRAASVHALTVVHGPPGTGKTQADSDAATGSSR